MSFLIDQKEVSGPICDQTQIECDLYISQDNQNIEENSYNYKTYEWEGTGRGTGCG